MILRIFDATMPIAEKSSMICEFDILDMVPSPNYVWIKRTERIQDYIYIKPGWVVEIMEGNLPE